MIVALEGDSSGKRESGRHAHPATKWRDDAVDYLRYRAVETLRTGGHRVPAVYDDVAERLRLEDDAHASASAEAIKKAYQRVIKRTGAMPRRTRPSELRYHPRYFPDIATLHLLHAVETVGNTPPTNMA